MLEDSLLRTEPEEIEFITKGSQLQEVSETVFKLGFDIIDIVNEELYYIFILKENRVLLLTASEQIKSLGFLIDDKDLIYKKEKK